jgi:threonine aldolase
MFSFECDYHEGAHQKVLLKLIETNMEQLPGYGVDHYSEEARALICQACGCPEGQVFFFAGGTQTNITIIDSILRPYDGIISATTGHVNMHEAGGVEHSGHKVLTLPSDDGKIHPDALRRLITDHRDDEAWDHMVFPGGVYVSHPTEMGTLYTKAELSAIADICHEYKIPLFLDGARLGYGLASDASDLTLKDIAQICDVFYIGGTKVGALCGEAVVFPRGNAPENFFTIMKQRGCVFAKHRVVSLQFLALFEDNLYLQLGEQALSTAELLKETFRAHGFQFYVDSPTNMQFLLVENELIPKMKEKVGFEVSGKADDDHSIVRFCTSWATTPADIECLSGILDEIVS